MKMTSVILHHVQHPKPYLRATQTKPSSAASRNVAWSLPEVSPVASAAPRVPRGPRLAQSQRGSTGHLYHPSSGRPGDEWVEDDRRGGVLQ